VEMENKIYDSGKETPFKTKKKPGYLKIKISYKIERVENFKYLGVILHEDNTNSLTRKN
jgi:hypothetical protein